MRSRSQGTARGKRSTRAARKAPAARRGGAASRTRQEPSTIPGPFPGKLRAKLPAILLEGDAPGTPTPLKRRTEANAPASSISASTLTGSLPEAYGTRGLRLTPRDPHWLHAHWDFTRQQLGDVNRQSSEGHLVLRLFNESAQEPVLSETAVHPESIQWMVHVPQAGASYSAELGFYDRHQEWSVVAASGTVRTPPSGPSTDRGFELATLSAEGQVERHGPAPPLMLPTSATELAPPGTRPGSSLGLTAGFSDALPPGLSSLSPVFWSSLDLASSESAPSGRRPAKPFGLELNAELIIHGATGADATLRVGDRIIPLEPDGTFRLRFALPDGAYDIPIQATASGTGEQRSVHLRFSRSTEKNGTVGTAPHAQGITPPGMENL